jgi:predicted RNase H-like HicB family nuclease
MRTVGDRMKERRLDLGLSQDVLAHKQEFLIGSGDRQEERRGGDPARPGAGDGLGDRSSVFRVATRRSQDFGGTATMITHHEYRGYVFTITYLPQEPAYTVDFPDFPDIITSGITLAEAFANACEALDLHLESMQKLGKRPPKPKHRLVVQAS